MQVDLFFYREPEEAKQQEDEEAAPQIEYGLVGGDQWTTAQIPDAAWPGEAEQPISAAPTTLVAAASDGWEAAVPPPASWD